VKIQKNKFHIYLANSNKKDISVKLTETRSFDNQVEAEKYEMELLKNDLLQGYEMLNTKKRTKNNKTKEIAVSKSDNRLTLEQFNAYYNGKRKI